MHTVKGRIELISYRNRWNDPELLANWTKEIAETRDPKRRRSILIRLATPRWANREKMIAIYMERDRLWAETGVPHDVDHIIPIIHPLVCGLHCEFNLRVISANENRSKSNKFDVDWQSPH